MGKIKIKKPTRHRPIIAFRREPLHAEPPPVQQLHSIHFRMHRPDYPEAWANVWQFGDGAINTSYVLYLSRKAAEHGSIFERPFGARLAYRIHIIPKRVA